MTRIELNRITKRYPGCVANRDVSLSVDGGEIHALLGENGAGKSTLMKIIYGVVKPDAGDLFWEGEHVEIRGAGHARGLGIGMVFQHFSLFETLTVAENIALSLPASEVGSMDTLKARITEVSVRYGMRLDPDRTVHSLSIGEQQRVEIVRCLLQNVKLLILDEPTSVLTPQEVETLFATLHQLAAEGCSILFISHKLDEVIALCDRATILRAGQVTGECVPEQVSVEELARMMVGDETPLSENYSKKDGGEILLECRKLNYRPEDPFASALQAISLQLKAGEILGIAGVAGNGQEELMRLISGEETSAADTVVLNGRSIGKDGPAKRRAQGLCVVPEERLGRGAVADMSLENNALLTAYQSGLVSGNGWLNLGQIRKFTQRILSRFNVKAEGSLAQAKSLSGGNLQKFILGREILQQPRVLICSHPTWGVDIGAAILIRHALIELRDQGAAVLMVSEDIDELFMICDRLCGICDGRLSPVRKTGDLSINELGQWMAGQFDVESELSDSITDSNSIEEQAL
ncbi:MAG: ABC transporter [Oleiphilus sp.]|nr:MAG: ABC transporter [Oleiphilus sp.]